MLLAQDGHAPSGKIERGLATDLIDGAVFCPRAHSSGKIQEVLSDYKKRYAGKIFALDPNFYVSVFPADRTGKLDSFPFFQPNLRKAHFASLKNIQSDVKNILDYQIALDLPYLISPGVIVQSFSSAWGQINLQLYSESIEYARAQKVKSKLLLCLPIGEAALREDEQLSDFLDELTALEVDGFYVFVERATREAPQWSDATTLSGLLYLTNSLSGNDYEVFIGYVDMVGILLKAVGAKAISNGWWRNLKQFTKDRYLEGGGGKPPRITYTSSSLLNSIFIDPELQIITEVGFGNEVLSHSSFDAKLGTDPINQAWTQEEATLHYWEVLRNLCNEIDKLDSVERKLALVKEKIQNAKGLYARLKGSGIGFESISGPIHLKVWEDSIVLFEQEITSP